MLAGLKSLGGAAKEAATAAGSKVAVGVKAVGAKVGESETFHQITHGGKTKEEMKLMHNARMKMHQEFMSAFLSAGTIPAYPVQKAAVDKLMLGLGMLNIAAKVTSLDKLQLAITGAKALMTGQIVQQFLGDMFNSGVIDLVESLHTDDPTWMKRNNTMNEPALMLAMLLLVVRDSSYSTLMHPVATHAADDQEPPIFPDIEPYALLAQAAYTVDETEFQDFTHTIFPGYHMLVSLPEHKKGDGDIVADNHPAFRILASPAAKTAILLIRGTASSIDVETDSKATAVAFPSGGAVAAGSQSFAHEGMLLAAKHLLQSPLHPTMDWLNQLAEKGYKIRLCGHSLGAGTAALASFLLRHPDFNPKCKLYESSGSLQVLAFSIPSVVSEAIADSLQSISQPVPHPLSPIFNVSLGDDAVPRMNTRNGMALVLQLKALMGDYDVEKTKDATKRPVWLKKMMELFEDLKDKMPKRMQHFASFDNQNANAAKEFVSAQMEEIISSVWWILHGFEQAGIVLPEPNFSDPKLLGGVPNVLVSPGYILYLSVKEGQPVRKHWITHRSGSEGRLFFNTLRLSAQSGFDHTMDFVVPALHEAIGCAQSPYVKFRNPPAPAPSELSCKIRFAGAHRGVACSPEELAAHVSELQSEKLRLVRCQACLSLVCSDLVLNKRPVPSVGIYRAVKVCLPCCRSGCDVQTWQNPYMK